MTKRKKININNQMVADYIADILRKREEKLQDFSVMDIEMHYWDLREKVNGKEDVEKYLPFMDSQLPKMSDDRIDKIYGLIESQIEY